jgi:hypothetical protein
VTRPVTARRTLTVMTRERELYEGDEVQCGHCRGWHPTFRTQKNDPHPYSQLMLFFRCPRAGGPFFAGTLGHPAHNRESRPSSVNTR